MELKRRFYGIKVSKCYGKLTSFLWKIKNPKLGIYLVYTMDLRCVVLKEKKDFFFGIRHDIVLKHGMGLLHKNTNTYKKIHI
jgi:hypothetical protein